MEVGIQVGVGVDLGQREISQQSAPGVPGIGAGITKVIDQVGGQHRNHVGGHDSPNPVTGVALQRRWWRTGGRCPDPGAEQQEP